MSTPKGRKGQKQKSKSAPKPKRAGGSRQKKSKNSTSKLTFGKMKQDVTKSIPSGFSSEMSSSLFLDVSGNVWHPQLGTQGIRVIGRQPQATVTTTTGTNHMFNSAGSTNMDFIDDNHFELNPLDLGSLLRQYATMYAKYCIRKIDFVYTSSLGTNTSNSTLAMGIKQDGGTSTLYSPAPATFGDVRSCEDSCTFNSWTPKCVLSYVYKGFDTWYTGYGASNDAIGDSMQADLWLRSTCQALFSMYPNFPSASSTLAFGLLDIIYEVEFFFPVLQSGLGLGLSLTQDEKDLILAMRDEKKKPSILDLRREKKVRKQEPVLEVAAEDYCLPAYPPRATLSLSREPPEKEVSPAKKLLAVLLKDRGSPQ